MDPPQAGQSRSMKLSGPKGPLHCGYLVGIGFPPSWTGGGMATGLAPNSRMELKAAMLFHLHSWFTDTDCADYFISNTATLTDTGCEILTKQTP